MRFSLVSQRPIPESLIKHARRTIAEVAKDASESPVQHPLLTARTWLFEPGKLEPAELDALRNELRGPAMALAVDSALITGPMAKAGPRAIITDVDSTFITTEVIEMLAARAGAQEQVREVTAAAMRGELDFAESLHHRVATLAGLPATVFEEVFADVQLSPGARELVNALHARGGHFGLVSGGFTEVVSKIVADAGVDEFCANHLEVKGGQLTGRVISDVVDSARKVRMVEQWAQKWGISPKEILCAGDGANDLPMMRAAGFGVAYLAKPIVLEQADAAITFPRLDAIAALVGWDIES